MITRSVEVCWNRLAMKVPIGEILAKVGIGKPDKVSLVAKAGPLIDDTDSKGLARRKKDRAAWLPGSGRVSPLPPFVNQDVEGYEQRFEIQAAPPFVCGIT
jgi:hypothetical protein